MIIDSELTKEEIEALENTISEYLTTNKVYIEAAAKRGSIESSISTAIRHGWKERNKFKS